MELVDGQLISSATDLINHLECPHLTYLNIEIALALQHKQMTDMHLAIPDSVDWQEIAGVQFSCKKKKKPTPTPRSRQAGVRL